VRREVKIRCGNYNERRACLFRSSWSLPQNGVVRCRVYIKMLFVVAISSSSVCISEDTWGVNCRGCAANVLKPKGDRFLKIN
jgi:hypothetical protein